MCGICGYAGIEDEQLIERMKNRLKHRGPDGEGTYYSPQNKLALGHRRLSIIDLSTKAAQPMRYLAQDLYIVFNGEIYNYVELREELLSKGYTFATDSDTEVILAAYREWGEDCVARFNGMFAFALWDESEGKMFCARDRFGEKPFYYYHDRGVIVFASEIKALLECEMIKRSPNEALIYDFLVYGHLEHTNETFFSNIHKLPPAHTLSIRIGQPQSLAIKRYWQPAVSTALESDKTGMDNIAAEFVERLKQSVSIRLRSDVPVGSCLSGGLDSSTIVLLVNKLLRDDNNLVNRLGVRQKVFTFCSDNPEFDERQFAEEVIAASGVEKNHVFASSEDLIGDLYKLAYHQEEPFTTTSIYAQWAIMRTAKSRGITVLLDGQGGDEVLGGYRKYRIYILKEYLKRGNLIKAGQEFIAGLLQIKKCYNWTQDLQKIRQILHIAAVPSPARYINRQFMQCFADRRPERAENMADALTLDMVRYSIPSLLRYEDKNSMAFSIEARVPFLDHEFVEYANALPYDKKIYKGWSKWILRKAMAKLMPDKVRLRKDKMGFVTTEAIWIREKAEYFLRLLRAANANGSMARKYVDLDMVIKDFRNIVDGRTEANLWRIISLVLWFEVFFSANNLYGVIDENTMDA